MTIVAFASNSGKTHGVVATNAINYTSIMTNTDTPTCDKCEVALVNHGTDEYPEWHCPGPCAKEHILWKINTGKGHLEPECGYLLDATKAVTQRDSGTVDELCAYCTDDYTPATHGKSLAKQLTYADDPEAQVREFFGGEAQP